MKKIFFIILFLFIASNVFGVGIDRQNYPFGEVGVARVRPYSTIGDTASSISVTSTVRCVEIYNMSSGIVYYGGSDVTSFTGIPIPISDLKIFNNIKSTFNIYVVCAAGQTAELRIVEYE